MVASITYKRIDKRCREFLTNLGRGYTMAAAAKMGGYTTPERDIYPIILDPTVQAEMRRRVRAAIQMEGAPVVYAMMLETVVDKTMPISARLDAGKSILAAAGYTSKRSADDDLDEAKRLQDMTSDELKAALDRVESVLAQRSKLLNPDPPALPPAQDIESLM